MRSEINSNAAYMVEEGLPGEKKDAMTATLLGDDRGSVFSWIDIL